MTKKILAFSALFIVTIMVASSPMFVHAQDPFVGGTLITPLSSEPLTLNPFTWGSIYESHIIGHMYDALVQYDVNNQPVPVLCESWSYNETYEEWTFTLRDDVVWHDGTPLTTLDVNFTWHTFWEDPGIPRRSWLFNDVVSITVVDDLNIKVEFSWGPKPADVLIEFADAWIVPMHIWEDVLDIYSFTNADNPIGCGPFVFEEWAPGQFFRFSRNENYYLDGPWVETKIVQLIPQVEVQYYALSTGEIELLGNPPEDLENLAKVDPNIEIHEYLDDYIMYLTMNQRNYPNNVTAFRQAVLHAINRTEIIEVAGYGRGLVAPESMSLPYGPYYNPDIPMYEYDVARANQILDDLGWVDTNEDDVREDGNGDPLEFDLMVSAEAQESVDGARMIQEYMVAIGVDITLQPVIFDVLWDAVGGPGGTYPGKYDYDWAYLGWVGFWSDRHPNWAAWMFSEDLWWGSDDVNIPGWSGANRTAVTDLVTDIIYETDEGLVLDMLGEVQEIIAWSLPYLPIRVLGGVALYRTDTFTGWVMGNTTGPNNWESWAAVHLIEPEGLPGFELMTTALAIFFIIPIARYIKRRQK